MTMMDNKICTQNTCCCVSYTRKISGSSILAGAFIAIGLIILFKILTLGIGLSLVTRNETGISSLMMGGFIWLFIGAYLTFFLAGWATGFLAKNCSLHACHGILYGFLMWSVTLVICLILEASSPSSMVFTFSKMFAVTDPQTDLVYSAHRIGVAALSGFLILLAGALGSCFGAYFSIKCCKSRCDHKPDTTIESSQPPYQR